MPQLLSWAVHLFTSTGALCAVLAIHALSRSDVKECFTYMFIAFVIDSVDGFFARRMNVKKHLPSIDGKLLDLVVDFTNFVIVPAAFVLFIPLVEFPVAMAALIIAGGCYNYGLEEDSTADGYFKGFPAAWHFVVFYLFLFDLNPLINSVTVMVLFVMHFLPFKVIYLTRTLPLPFFTIPAIGVGILATVVSIFILPYRDPGLCFALIAVILYFFFLGLMATFRKKET